MTYKHCKYCGADLPPNKEVREMTWEELKDFVFHNFIIVENKEWHDAIILKIPTGNDIYIDNEGSVLLVDGTIKYGLALDRTPAQMKSIIENLL